MKLARFAIALTLLAVALAPELARYRAERELKRLTSVAMAVASGRVPASSSAPLLRDTSRKLEVLARAMPGDVRPRLYAAGAALLLRDYDRATELYLGALACGERGETDVHLGRTFAATGDSRADAMFVRAVWVSPGLIASVPKTHRERIRRTVARRIALGGQVGPPELPVLPLSTPCAD